MRSGVYPGIGRRIKLLQQTSMKENAPRLRRRSSMNKI